ncbi:unnamed protein product, partial [Owenia fusiformis]
KTNDSNLKSMQYNAGRAILSLKGTPAYEAIIADLGWSPIKFVILKRQIEYFLYVKYHKPHSLNAFLLSQMEKRMQCGTRNPRNYVHFMHSALIKLGFSGGSQEPEENIRRFYSERIHKISND